VIEPSFGLDRILYACLEHNYHEETVTDEESGKSEEYRRLALPGAIAPVKAAVFPLVSKGDLPEVAKRIVTDLKRAGILTQYDDSGSIGRRYARMDEIGTPFCVTVDFDTVGEGESSDKRDTVTVRHRDSKEQDRLPIDQLPGWIRNRLY